MRRRTRARELAIQSLYQFDVRGDEAADDVEQLIDEAASDDETRSFARRLIRGTREMLVEADLLLGEVARNWDLKRMAIIDRNILRMAIYELYRCPDIPTEGDDQRGDRAGQEVLDGELRRLRQRYPRPRAHRSREPDPRGGGRRRGVN